MMYKKNKKKGVEGVYRIPLLYKKRVINIISSSNSTTKLFSWHKRNPRHVYLSVYLFRLRIFKYLRTKIKIDRCCWHVLTQCDTSM